MSFKKYYRSGVGFFIRHYLFKNQQVTLFSQLNSLSLCANFISYRAVLSSLDGTFRIIHHHPLGVDLPRGRKVAYNGEGPAPERYNFA